jgi:putative ABC transport system permease protein
MLLQFKLAFRNLLRQKTRTALTLTAIAVGVMALVLARGFVQDIFYQLQEATIHSQFGHVQMMRAGYQELGRRAPGNYLIQIDEAVRDDLQRLPEVKNVMLRLDFSGLLHGRKGSTPVFGQAVEAAREAELGTALNYLAGNALTDADAYGIAIGEGLANTMHLSVGDLVTLLVSTFDGSANTAELKVVGLFRSFSKEYDETAVHIGLQAGKELLDTQAVHRVVLELHETRATDRVASLLNDLFPAGDLEILPWYRLADFYEKTVALYRRQFAVLQFIVLVMVLLSVINTVNMAIYERTAEFSTLRALGTRGQGVVRLLLSESLIAGVVGVAIGLAVAVMIGQALSAIGIPMPPPPNSNAGYIAHIRLDSAGIGMAAMVGMLATLLATLLPAWRAARYPIIDGLRQAI